MMTSTHFNMPILSSRSKIKTVFFPAILIFLIGSGLQAQSLIENVVVETYYISDSLDATDTTGGYLEKGSKTYRIYVDLAPSVRLKRIYGDQNHPLIFNSTDTIFNNAIDGKTFGKDFQKTRLQENTVGLDTWITLSQTTKFLLSGKTTFGVLKANDSDGSFIGGSNNDLGLLANNDPLAGIPLTIADGNDTITISTLEWPNFGFTNTLTQEDSTIFGSLVPGTRFESRNCYLSNSGVMGIDSVVNHILVAQITTKGELSFELNLEVQLGNQTVKLVARDSVLNTGEEISAFLSYPQACGCQDPNYLEYSPSYACNIQDSCQTLIVFGCMDPLACNFSSSANFNIADICCYIGDCNDLDISIVCPELSINDIAEQKLIFFPNPGKDMLSVQANFNSNSLVSVQIINAIGQVIYTNSQLKPSSGNTILLDDLNFNPGVYFVSVKQDNQLFNAYWSKQ
jgi:hypothetical protein